MTNIDKDRFTKLSQKITEEGYPDHVILNLVGPKDLVMTWDSSNCSKKTVIQMLETALMDMRKR